MSQTSYGLQQTPLPGVLYDHGVKDAITAVNTDSTWNIPFGVMVARNGTTQGCSLPAAAGAEMLGISLLEHSHDPGPNGTLNQSAAVGSAPGPGLIKQTPLSVLRKGRCWVAVETDAAITAGSKAFVRFAQNGAGKLQLGAFRMNADGVAQVDTVTPTAVNATIYVLRVEAGGSAYEFEFLSDGAATATKIVTGFKTLMAADLEFSALITASGTTTLILTGAAGVTFTTWSEGDGAMAVAHTTPPAANAVAVKARFITGSYTIPTSSGGQGNVGQSAGAGQATTLAAVVEFDASVF